MLARLGIQVPLQAMFTLFISFSFFIGLLLMVSPEAFSSLERIFNKEYGFKRKLVPKLEDAKVEAFDKIIIKNRGIAGMIICIVSFLMLIWYR